MREISCAQCSVTIEATGSRSTYCETCREGRKFAAWLRGAPDHVNIDPADHWFILSIQDELRRQRVEGARAIKVALRDGAGHHTPRRWAFDLEIAELCIAVHRVAGAL